MRQCLLLFLLTGFHFSVLCQQRDGMEYAIKDSAALSQYKSAVLSLGVSDNKAELARTYKRIADYYYVEWQNDSMLCIIKKR
jgi:hypothetical protein